MKTMKKTDLDALQQAKQYIVKEKFVEAEDLIVQLRKQYPQSSDVAKLWCSLAMRTGRIADVPEYAEKIYRLADNEFQKALWAHYKGTAYFMLLNLPNARLQFELALNHLMAWAKAGKVPLKKQKENQSTQSDVFATGKAEQLLWETCVALAGKGIPAFPFAGTLLGLVRNGQLLDFDKDLDIAVWMESWDACCTELEKMGWVRPSMGIQYSNYRDYVHSELGITLDICGLQADGKRITGGFCLPDRPPEYQRVSVFPKFELEQRTMKQGDVYFPKQPELILNAFYGDWRTPNPNWDTVISAVNLEKFTLLVRCYAYHRLVQYWLRGNLEKAWCYAYQIVLRDPDDVVSLRCRQWLERALVRLNRDIPCWPQNKKQIRVFTRMVADLFHVGHINFLRTAKSLGTHLTVCVVPDERVLDNKGKLPVMTQMERVAAVSACKYVDHVITESPVNATLEFMRQNGFDLYAFACADEKERADKYRQCALLPREMIRELDYTPGISSTDIVQRILKAC